ncbi:MAG: SRPBCC family protein [Methylotenera sp.]|nr:SRPBCC family protein [Oligoflexia bacterium]
MPSGINAKDPKKRPSQFETYESEQWVARPLAEVFSFFSLASNLEILTPPWLNFHLTQMSTPELGNQTLIDYRLKIHGIPVKWRTRIEEWIPNQRFVDTQLRGPYRYWHHTHGFEKKSVNGIDGTLMRDRVLYLIPGGFLGKAVMGRKVRTDIQGIFAFRTQKIEELFPAQG